MPSLHPYLVLMRPHQYVKNFFMFLPAFFALHIFEWQTLLRTAWAFGAFSLLASAVYIFNDYQDREADRQHPEKKHRPIAAGAVSPLAALLLMGVLAVIGLCNFFLLGNGELLLAGIYVGMNIAYSLKLKHIAIVDVCIIAVGFVLRIYIGAAAGNIPLSMWIVLMTFLLALFLGFAKRRDDVLLAATGKDVRKAIEGYTLEFINAVMVLMAAVLIVCYISYTVAPETVEKFHSRHLYTTVIFVIIGIFRYLQLTLVYQKSGNPTKILLRDGVLQATIVGWLLAFLLLIYGKNALNALLNL